MLTGSSSTAPHAWLRKAEQQRKRGALDRAFDSCKRSVRECPWYVPGHIALARLCLDLGDTAGAREALNAAVQWDPANPVAGNLLARLDLADGIRQEAARRLTRILLLYPRDVEATALLREALRPTVSEPNPALGEATHRLGALSSQSEMAVLDQLRSNPGVAWGMIINRQGLPVLGSVGGGEETDCRTAAAACRALQACSAMWPESTRPGRAIVECAAGTAILVRCNGGALLVGLSPQVRLGQVLDAVDRAAQRLTAAHGTAHHETDTLPTE